MRRLIASGSRTTSYIQSNSSTVNAASMSSATKFEHWYYISDIDVMAALTVLLLLCR